MTLTRQSTSISARLRFLEALTADLVAELPPTKRDRLLHTLEMSSVACMFFQPPYQYRRQRAGVSRRIAQCCANSS